MEPPPVGSLSTPPAGRRWVARRTLSPGSWVASGKPPARSGGRSSARWRGGSIAILTVVATGILSAAGLATTTFLARAQGPPSDSALAEVVVHVTDLPKSALSEFEFWNDRASPGGRLVGTPNTGDDLDPPPENDPHVRFPVRVQRGVPYRCWIHMKVGKPKGVSRANRLYVQFTNAVDQANREILQPGTGSYLTAQGPEREGWAWVGCDRATPKAPGLVQFRTSGEVTVRIQAGMEGVGFDQVLLSPARFLHRPPTEPVVSKPPK